jgi:hypothetical protein
MKKRLLLLPLALLLVSRTALAQPGPDPAHFNALDICFYTSLERSVVFVGRVLSVEEIQNQTDSGPPRAWKLVATPETVLKGDVNQEQELYLPVGYMDSLESIRGSTFVFLANQVTNGLFSGLFADRWSFRIDSIGKEEWARRLSEIQAIFNGVAQPQIVGMVTAWPWNGSFTHPGQKSDNALAGITVVAEDKDGNRFTTETDEAGRFQFEKLPLPAKRPVAHTYLLPSPGDQLPAGAYVVSLVLPKKMDVYSGYPTYSGYLLDDGKQAAVQLGTSLCSATLQFNVRESGTISGHIVREGGISQSSEPKLRLYRYDPETKRILSSYGYNDFVPTRMSFSGTGGNRSGSFSFEHVPIGPYVLEISNFDPDGTAHSFYYPQTKFQEEATIINVRSDKPAKVQVTLPWVLPN